MTATNKQEAMLHAVITTISHTGFKDLKMDDFIKMMPASRSTVYRYFPSRESIIEAVVAEYIDYIDEFDVPQELTTSGECVAGFQSLLEQAIIFNSNISPVFLNDLANEFSVESKNLQNAIDEHDHQAREFYLTGQKNQMFNQQNIGLWLLQDQVMIPKLIDPHFLFSRNLTLKDALTDYAEMKAQQILAPALLTEFDLKFLEPVIKEISQLY